MTEKGCDKNIEVHLGLSTESDLIELKFQENDEVTSLWREVSEFIVKSRLCNWMKDVFDFGKEFYSTVFTIRGKCGEEISKSGRISEIRWSRENGERVIIPYVLFSVETDDKVFHNIWIDLTHKTIESFIEQLSSELGIRIGSISVKGRVLNREDAIEEIKDRKIRAHSEVTPEPEAVEDGNGMGDVSTTLESHDVAPEISQQESMRESVVRQRYYFDYEGDKFELELDPTLTVSEVIEEIATKYDTYGDCVILVFKRRNLSDALPINTIESSDSDRIEVYIQDPTILLLRSMQW